METRLKIEGEIVKKIVKWLALVLLAGFVGTGFVGAQGNESAALNEIEEEFSFENATKKEVPEVASLPSGSSGESGLLHYRLAQGRDRSYHVLIVSGLLLGSLTIILAFLTRIKGACTPAHLVTATGLPLVIFGTILVILLSDTEQQLTAAVGLLGAVAGYVFRSMQQESPEPAPPRP
jgi:hypothetical protein